MTTGTREWSRDGGPELGPAAAVGVLILFEVWGQWLEFWVFF